MSKKVLILSQRNDEYSTDDILDWLEYYSCSFVRINGIDLIKNVKVEMSNDSETSIDIQGHIDWDEIGVVWFRRWLAGNEAKSLGIKSEDKIELTLSRFIFEEIKQLRKFFFSLIPSDKIFDRMENVEINKLLVLQKAKNVGLRIPDTFIITKKSQLDFDNKITKAISNPPMLSRKGDGNYMGYTTIISDDLDIPETFAPSLLQKNIQKKFEIRAFLLKDKFYSMAIFSQNNAQTETDFRIYDGAKPNRTVPYKLPRDIELKLLELAKHFNIETGSFDLILSKDKEYVFLEVNPGGQFGMVSYPCNYFLDRSIALELKNQNQD